jgi:hypothetical protein
MEAATAARVMNRYARAHAGGAFASPTAAELADTPMIVDGGTVAAIRRVPTRATRNDWTGTGYWLPPGATEATFVAHDPTQGCPSPQLATVDVVNAYADDPDVSSFLTAHGYVRYATRITSASEIITVWTTKGLLPPRREQPADLPTAATIPQLVHPQLLGEMRDELAALSEWHDDYPYYSDGTWGAVNLRGYNPADPLWGVKPAEMPRKWQREHPLAVHYECDWTTITDRLPAMRGVTEWLAHDLGADELQRVRLMRMAGKPGGGKLARHSDVTDRQAGTRDGQVARFHIPLVTHPNVTMSVWELNGTHRQVHLAPGTVWYLDQRKPHAVTNPTDTDRIHLVVDVICNPSVRHHLERLELPA